MELREREQSILEAIENAVRENGYPPTVREIAAAVGLSSPASVQSYLGALEAKGYIRRGTGKRRALEVVNRGASAPRGRSDHRRVSDFPEASAGSAAAGEWPSSVAVPLVARVAAGAPLLADENIEGFIEIPRLLGEESGCFALRVKGDSMIKAGILDGDIVVVRHQATADDGDIVVALLDDEATLKRMFREDGRVRLQPQNDAMEPIYTGNPRIVGKVTGLLRRL